MGGPDLLIGRYELRSVLGLGGMAEVRDGWDTRLHRAVAIKLLHPMLNADAGIRRRFEEEARAAASLSHPNIVAVHDYGLHEGTPFIVMERLPGRTLADVISDGPMTPVQVRAMLDDVLAALGVAHAAGVLHRDIKPANILLSSSGDRMKVADFGIAKTGGAAAHTMTGHIVGTMCYMSPERISGVPASVADDLYAVGVMAYEALLARRAFPHENPAVLARAIIDAPPPPISTIRNDVDPVLAGTIARAMARDPGHRFISAEQMRAALAADSSPSLAGAASTPGPRPATKILAQPLPPSVPYLAAPPTPRRLTGRTRTYATVAAAIIAFAISALALAMEPFSTAPAPEPVSTSSSVPPPPTTPPPAPPSSSVTPAQSEPTPDPPKDDDEKEDRPGKGNGGRGEGNKKPD
ncbi:MULTISPECIES: serine/threonine-protein kinase [Mycolicibacterium]|jgi:serine/threonine-protein kinase|uniref:serine/threonine-protein kinase n=1 Tax=Mycolicibacterium TaxID=1866885 RepID=UPI001CA337B1|nr:MULTISPECIES: serine/threonine-protein kinase [Mycolicibacterium]MDW5615127.1 serine/threonine-protein kinase [Mycolicibacterium sp. D5.8-2]QZT63777.1 serine/threonine protein kinase [Mycolicibacterium austroafricanum]